MTELDPSGAALAYSTFLGGTGVDEGHAIALGRRGRAYVTGLTSSADFPTTPGAVDASQAVRSYDAFVTKLETYARGDEDETTSAHDDEDDHDDEEVGAREHGAASAPARAETLRPWRSGLFATPRSATAGGRVRMPPSSSRR